MIDDVKNVLVTIPQEGRYEDASAFRYGLSLARRAAAPLTVQAPAGRFHIPYTVFNAFAQKIVSAENQRVAALAEHFADMAKAEADFAGSLHRASARPRSHRTQRRAIGNRDVLGSDRGLPLRKRASGPGCPSGANRFRLRANYHCLGRQR